MASVPSGCRPRCWTRIRLEREGSSPEPRDPDAELLEKLRALGYLGEPESAQ
jgi:hypothetical protein